MTMAKEPERIATVGYHREKGAQTFSLAPGEELPPGFRDHPYPGQHPNDADNQRPTLSLKKKKRDDDDDDERPTAEEAEAGEKRPETTHGRGHATAHK
jgi:hypothetical protein